MVRFHWPVEGGHSAWVPPGGIKADEAAGVRHVSVEMELAGQNETVASLLTVPTDYLDAAKVSPLGVLLAHGGDAEGSWRGPLLERLAGALAAAGHVVVRYFCPLKEQRRHRILEKAFDVASTSPYASTVRQWVLVGFDNGARIAAGGERAEPAGDGCLPPSLPAWAGRVATRGRPAIPAAVAAKLGARGTVSLAGLVFLSYPLLDPQPPPPKQKQGAAPPADSIAPLAKLSDLNLPALFVCGEFDRLCPGARLQQALAEVLPGCDARLVVLEDLNGRFCVPGTKEVAAEVVERAVGHARAFVAALAAPGGAAACDLPRAADVTPSERPLPDVPESPKREASPEEEEEEEPEPEPELPPRRATVGAGRGTRGGGQRGGAAPAAPAAAGARPGGVPPGMVAVMGPHGQPMLVPAAMAGNAAAQQQMLLLQQQMLAAHLQKQQQVQARGGVPGLPAAAQVQQMQQMQMAILQAQMAAAARPAGAAPATAPAAAAAPPQQQQQQPAPMAVDPQ